MKNIKLYKIKLLKKLATPSVQSQRAHTGGAKKPDLKIRARLLPVTVRESGSRGR